ISGCRRKVRPSRGDVFAADVDDDAVFCTAFKLTFHLTLHNSDSCLSSLCITAAQWSPVLVTECPLHNEIRGLVVKGSFNQNYKSSLTSLIINKAHEPHHTSRRQSSHFSLTHTQSMEVLWLSSTPDSPSGARHPCGGLVWDSSHSDCWFALQPHMCCYSIILLFLLFDTPDLYCGGASVDAGNGIAFLPKEKRTRLQLPRTRLVRAAHQLKDFRSNKRVYGQETQLQIAKYIPRLFVCKCSPGQHLTLLAHCCCSFPLSSHKTPHFLCAADRNTRHTLMLWSEVNAMVSPSFFISLHRRLGTRSTWLATNLKKQNLCWHALVFFEI
ncbi:hypothetical protein JOB18_045974, partial [Solea senegalensis]